MSLNTLPTSKTGSLFETLEIDYSSPTTSVNQALLMHCSQESDIAKLIDAFDDFEENFGGDAAFSTMSGLTEKSTGGLCLTCNKAYKSAAGLERHNIKKHKVVPEFTQTILNDLIKDTIRKICTLDYLPDTHRYAFTLVDSKPGLLDAINSVIKNHRDNVNFIPKFTTTIYPFFSSLDRVNANLFVDNLCKVVLKKRKGMSTFANSTENQEKPLTLPEHGVVTYLAGHCFGKKFRQTYAKNKKHTPECEERRSILECARIDASDKSNYNLVNGKNRGGLWLVSDEIVNMFLSVEVAIRILIRKKPRKFNDKELTILLFNEPFVTSVLTFLIDNSQMSKEACGNVLQDVISLYIRIRIYRFLKQFNKNLLSTHISFRASLISQYVSTSKK